MMDIELIRKYNVPGPRYTSYPTVPYWDAESLSDSDWKRSVRRSFEESTEEGMSLYIHLPFCESLCTFCGCHKRITKKHHVEKPYIDSILKEWALYTQLFEAVPKIKELHLGGGTPTFFRVEQLQRLIEGILATSTLDDEYEFSFEGHPNYTSKEQLQALYDLGFRRNSFGVQDYDPIVQKTIHRIQSFEQVQRVHNWSKEIGYTSISHDLVFGLPKQTRESVRDTIEKTCTLRPGRIAYYSYAHVPWIKGVGQRGFDVHDLPKNELKRELYELGKEMFDAMGYIEVGMDHFALPEDSLSIAMHNQTMHRNFMGYTSGKTQLMVGLGMSSISDSWYAFAQNNKSLEEYQAIVEQGRIPIFRGHLLTEEDLIVRQHILNLMCHFETSWKDAASYHPVLDAAVHQMDEMIADGLVECSDKSIHCTEKGRPFVRNICMLLDARMLRKKPQTRIFSQTI